MKEVNQLISKAKKVDALVSASLARITLQDVA